MFNIKKKNNHNDISLYMSDIHTVATIDFYRKKHRGRLPEYMYQMMEAAARKEYTDEDMEAIKLRAQKEKQAFDKQIMDEYEERGAEDYVNIVEQNNIFA